MDLELTRRVFLQSASDDFRTRWVKVRNVTTSVDLMTAVARLSGWTPVRWYPGDQPSIRVPDGRDWGELGQSVCVLVQSGV